MSRPSILILLGILIILVPFSGLPVSIRSLLSVIIGACIFGIGLSLRTREMNVLEAPAEPPHTLSV